MKLKAELWDKIQYLFRNYYDRMMHTVIYLENRIDTEKLKQTLSIILDKVEILRSRYVASKKNPYWIVEENNNLVEKVLTIIESKDSEVDLEAFITSKFMGDQAPQLRVTVIRTEKKDVLAMLVNHQCFDGGDFKALIYKLIEVYNNLINGGNGDVAIKNGSRANEQVYSTMSAEDRKIAKGMYKNVSKTKHQVAFPFTDDMIHSKAMIVKHKINSATFDKLREYGKTYDSTINDVLLAGYFRALYQLVNMDENQCITIPCMTDLRRHIEGGETAGFTNLTCLLPCTIDSVGPEFSATLKKVHGEMNRHKNNKFAGLDSIPLLELAYKVAPSCISELLIKAGYTNPFIGMSNIGILDENKLVFGNVKAEDAFMTGAIKYKPYMQLALTTFKKAITFTICIYGTASDRAIIEKFFKLFDKELNSVIK